MRRLICFVLVCFLLTSSAYAANENIGQGMMDKATRGIINLVTGIVELPVQTYKGYKNGFGHIQSPGWSKTVGTVLGFFRGVSHSAGRISWGGLELFGFWTANRPDNDGVGTPFDAQYAWEEGEQYSIFKPSLEEGIKPIGKKLVLGVADAVVGIVELPAQTAEGAFQGNAWVGLGKGVWFWLSREVYGFTNIFTCIVPNPQDNLGYPLNGNWPWSVLDEDLD